MKTYNNGDVGFKFEFLHYNQENHTFENLIHKVHKQEIDGFILKEVLSKDEIDLFLDVASKIHESEFLKTNTGSILPDPFATISDLNERLRNYIDKKSRFDNLGFNSIMEKLDEVMKLIGKPYHVRSPKMKINNSFAVPATVRHFYPDWGGLFVHCGYLFQVQTPVYYDAVEEMEKNGQLSFFIVIQKPDAGGELTLYDMIWENVNAKDFAENNEYVIDKFGNRVYLSDVISKKFNPEPGDLLIFYGGKIWHRVEPILGNKPRITLGGFINFSKDDQTCFYWS